MWGILLVIGVIIFYFFLATGKSHPETDCVKNNKLKHCKKIECKYLRRRKQNANYTGGIYTYPMTICTCSLKYCPYKKGIRCSNCGELVEDDAKKCKNCNEKIT